ncbi:periplasmic heavy metal sensor [Ostreiculturibacter nitratireducens]|uniref:periplasmic heavy metal sensor n=1 Tax=Ostreiculturibacter nitratireducens TaxID=3075226 RepID=UPI0031B5E815
MVDETQTGRPKGGTGRWTRVALIGSLALNLLFIGVFAGAGIDRARRPDQVELRELGFGPMSEALSPEDRAALRRAFLAEVPALRDERRAWREDTMRLVEALRAEPFDPGAVDAVTSRLTGRIAARLDLGTRLLLNRIGEMSAAERLGFANRLESSLGRMPHGGRPPRD